MFGRLQAFCRCFRSQKTTKIIAELILLLTIVSMVGGIIFYSYELYMHGKERQYIAWFSAGGFVLLTIPISIRSIILHLWHWDMPYVQKYVVRILWMVPIYSVESWLSLRFRRFSIQIEALRQSYEAYVIYSFLYFLISTLGDEPKLINILKEKPSSRGEHPWPVNKCLSPWVMGYDFLHNCKIGVLQYVLIENLLAFVIALLQGFHVYGEGGFRWDRGYLYVCLISSISQTWALYCMGIFYYGTWEELHPWRPVSKFVCVKMVVFFTWWQSFFISFGTDFGLIVARPGENNWTGVEIAKGIQDYLVCIEMLFFSIAFYYAFSYKDFEQPYVKVKGDDDSDESPDSKLPLPPPRERGQKPFFKALLDSSVPDNIFSDLKKYSKIRPKKEVTIDPGVEMEGEGLLDSPVVELAEATSSSSGSSSNSNSENTLRKLESGTLRKLSGADESASAY